MFSEFLKDEHRDATTPPATRSSKGTPSSSDQKGKRGAPVSPMSSSKRHRPSSSTLPRSSSTRHTSTPPPPPPFSPKDLGAGSSKSLSSPTGEVYTHLMLSLEKDEAPGPITDLLKGALPSGDRRLMSSLSSKDLDHMLTLVLAKATVLRGESLLRASGDQAGLRGRFLQRSWRTGWRLLGEVAELKESKKEAVGRYQKAEKEVKRLQREAKAQHEDNAEEFCTMADQVRKEFPETEEGRSLLEACWAGRLAEHKKSDAYQKEVALVADLFLHFAFEACRQQFLAHGYPPAGEDTSFLNFELVLNMAPNPFAKPITSMETPPLDSSMSACFV